MNIVHETILHACWSEENEDGLQTARPWLRWFLARVLEMKGRPVRESSTERMKKQQFLAPLKEAALRIDPETAEVFWIWGPLLDPYGIEEKCMGRNYFARSRASEVLTSFDDLPAAVRDRLWARLKAGDFDDADNELPF